MRDLRKRRSRTNISTKTKKRCDEPIEDEETPGCSGDDGSVQEMPGRIASIELTNFMCHKNLKMDFDVTTRNCFFIGGSNGTGKSALFAAMNIGLGGRGTQNERGSSLKEYIKDGENRAKIRIVLTNRGVGRCERYGDAIAVERTINFTSSTYSLKSITNEGGRCNEELITHKKTELDRILAKFSIQLDNPMSWMSQNRSREFLVELKPKKLYKIFTLATGLDFSRQWYDEGGADNTKAEAVLSDVRQACIEKKKEIEEQIGNRKRMQNIEKQKQELQELKQLFCWLPARDCHKELCKHKQLLEKANEVHTSLKGGYASKLAVKERYVRKLEESEKEKEKRQEELTTFRDEYNELEKAKKCRREEMLDTGQQLSITERKQKEVNVEITSMEEQLKDFEARKNRHAMEKHNIAETEAESFALEKQYLALLEKQHEAHEKCRNFKEKMTNFMQAERDVERKISRCNATLRELRNEKERALAMQRSDLARFGNSMPYIVQLIEQNAARFVKKPVGPIGAYVRVNKDSWALAVEKCLRNLLSTFLCDNGNDRKILELLLHKHNIRSWRCIITRFTNKRYNTAANEPPPQCVTVARMVTITDDTVFNTLVDQAQIESILLIESDSQARTVMALNPPRNVRKGFTKSGAEVFARTAKQAYRFYANRRQQKPRVLVNRQAANIKAVNQEVAKVEEELRNNTASLTEVRKNSEIARVEWAKETQQMKQTERQVVDAEARKRLLTKRLDAARMDGAVDGHIASLVEKLDDHRKQKEVLLVNAKALRERLTQSRQKLRDAEAERAQKAKELAEKEEYFRKGEQEWEEASRHVDEMKDCETEHNMKMRKIEERKKELDEKINLLSQKLEKMIEELSPGNPQPDLANMPDTAEAEERCRKLEHRIQAAQKGMEVALISEEALNALQNDYGRLRGEYADAKRLVLKMKHTVQFKNKQFLEARNAAAERLGETYGYLMSIRNFRGSLIIDHVEKAIKLLAKTQKDQIVRPKQGIKLLQDINPQDLKGLSGGERSYTLVCFVMALWEAMKTPFRCMDEFDVFLDLNNRKIVMELLADLATRQYPSYQFLFFTPQGVADFAHRDRVQIFEMPEIRK